MIPRIDFISDESSVVRCREKHQAVILMDTLLEAYPEAYSVTRAKISAFNYDGTEEGLCYRIRTHNNVLYIDHCFESYYTQRGFEIIDFDDLCENPDYGEFEGCYDDMADVLSALFNT